MFEFMQISHFADAFPHVHTNPWQGVYFHGYAEFVVQKELEKLNIEDCAVDLAACETPPPVAGVYPAKVYGQDATLFVWHSRSTVRGYVVIDSDEESMAFARQQFEAKPDFI